MTTPVSSRLDLFHGLFRWERIATGEVRVCRHTDAPAAIPDPHSGQLLHVATIDAQARAICPSCEATAQGGFVSFVQDLRLAYACPSCKQLVWLTGSYA